jgi:hypothetical protein
MHDVRMVLQNSGREKNSNTRVSSNSFLRRQNLIRAYT